MNVDAFVRQRQSDWTELDALLRRARGRPERLGPEGVLRMGALYRAAVADLARTRRAAPADPTVRRLEDLVGRTRRTVYGVQRRRRALRQYLLHDYWREVWGLGRVLVLACVLLMASAALAVAWGRHDPGAAAGVVPVPLSGAGGGPHGAIGLGVSQATELSVSIFTNNIGVTFTSFASGLLLGIAPALLLMFNGVLLGAVIGIGASTGHTADIVELLTPHGMLELSCMVIAAAAGMRMGWALVEPGTRGRVEALIAAARRGVLLVLATAPWLVLAGLIEGFLTPHHLSLPGAIAVGLAAAGPFWGLVVWRGRPVADGRRPAPTSQPERRLGLHVGAHARG